MRVASTLEEAFFYEASDLTRADYRLIKDQFFLAILATIATCEASTLARASLFSAAQATSLAYKASSLDKASSFFATLATSAA